MLVSKFDGLAKEMQPLLAVLDSGLTPTCVGAAKGGSKAFLLKAGHFVLVDSQPLASWFQSALAVSSSPSLRARGQALVYNCLVCCVICVV